MALINCPECEEKISDTVKRCPKCGCVLKKASIKKGKQKAKSSSVGTPEGKNIDNKEVTIEENLEKKSKKEKRKKKFKRFVITLFVLAIVGAGAYYASVFVVIPNLKYNKGVSLMESGDYEGAIKAFESLDNYKDSSEKIVEAYYMQGESLLENKDYEGAAKSFELAGTYKDATSRILEVYYEKGEALLLVGDYDGALNAFRAAGTYKDTAEKVQNLFYEQGKACLISGNFEEAVVAFKSAGTYLDAAEKILETYYKQGELLLTSGDYVGAIKAFELADSYKDADEKIMKVYYDQGDFLLETKDYEGAVKAFMAAGIYKDAEEKVFQTYYEQGDFLLANGDFESAVKAFESAGEYKDASEKAKNVNKYKFGQDVGTIVEFGGYEWIILAKDDDKTMLVTKECVELKEFSANSYYSLWEECSLREWLNGKFYDGFSEDEKLLIDSSAINTNSHLKLNQGNLYDKIFLLSVQEVVKYFTSDEQFIAKYNGTPVKWWLRTPGMFGIMASTVDTSGKINTAGESITEELVGVRPALWLSIE